MIMTRHIFYRRSIDRSFERYIFLNTDRWKKKNKKIRQQNVAWKKKRRNKLTAIHDPFVMSIQYIYVYIIMSKMYFKNQTRRQSKTIFLNRPYLHIRIQRSNCPSIQQFLSIRWEGEGGVRLTRRNITTKKKKKIKKSYLLVIIIYFLTNRSK